MDGWKTIKDVRLELSEATKLANDGHRTAAYACMLHAKSVLERYCKEERGPRYGFEGCNRKRV